MSLAPAHVTADPGDTNISVTINVNRAVSFAENISFTIPSPPPHVTATTPGDTGNAGTTSVFTVGVDSQATSGDVVLQVNGKSASWSASGSLQIHVGSLLHVGGGTFTVPSYANAVIVKAWGAGGGGGSGYSNNFPPHVSGPGGGGGFASATLPVTPGSDLEAIVATGGRGGGPASNCTWGSGGGGGFTALRVKGASSYLIVAGGGGGGGGFGLPASAGGGGGGQAGGDGVGGCMGYGGTQAQGGGSLSGGTYSCTPGGSGSAFQGGNAPLNSSCTYDGGAGTPGGGQGGANQYGSAGGGGGGGYFGGGSGGDLSSYYSGGGGGGSGWISVDAGTLMSGTGPVVGNATDADYALCSVAAGAGGAGGNPDAGTQAGEGGKSGCVVVRLSKP